MNAEILTAIAGLVGGGLFRMIGEFQKGQQAAFDRAMDRADREAGRVEKYDQSRNEAAKRGADWVRNLLIILTVAGVVIFPLVVLLIGKQTIYPVDIPDKEFLWFKWGGGLKFEQISGYLLTPEILRVYILAAFFFLGQGPLKRK